MHQGFQTQIPQALPMQRMIASPVSSLQHFGSGPQFLGPFNPAAGFHSPPRGVIQPPAAQIPNISSPVQQPPPLPLSSPLPLARGVTSPVYRPVVPSTLPSPRGIPSSVLQSSPFNSPSWQVMNPQPSVFTLNQGSVVMASTVPPLRGQPSPTQQPLVSSNFLLHKDAPSPTLQPPMSAILSPPRGIPSSPVQPLVPPTVVSPRGITSPVLQSSPFNSPAWQLRTPPTRFSPIQRSPVASSFPQPIMSPPSPSLRAIPSQAQQQFVSPTSLSPRGAPLQVQHSSHFHSPSQQVRNPSPVNSLHQGSSAITVALDKHIQGRQVMGMSSHMQQPSSSVGLGLAQPRKENIIQIPAAMTGPYGMWPPVPRQHTGLQPSIPQQVTGLRPPVQQQFSRFQPPVPQYFSPVKTRMPDFSRDQRSFGGQKSSSPSNPHHKSGFSRDSERGRERGNRRLVTDLQSIQGSKKVSSGCPGKVDPPSGQVTFHSHLPNGQEIGKPSAN